MTAEEILKEWLIQTDQTNLKEGHYFVIEQAMKEFAELKCKELLQIVAEKSKVKIEKSTPYKKYESVKTEENFNMYEYKTKVSVDRNSILNAVDLKEFIK